MPDREKVIKAIECCVVNRTKCFDDNDKLCPYFSTKVCMCENELLKDALALLKEQEPRWTSLKERYPEKEGFYLVSADHGNYLPWIAEMKIFHGVKGFCNGAVMPCVGAWMPLPEPYKEGSDDNE